MTVSRGQIEGRENASLEAIGLVRIREQRRQRVGPTLDLQQCSILHVARTAPGPVAGRDERIGGRVQRARAVAQRAGKEILEAGVRGNRLAHLVEVDTEDRSEQTDLRPLEQAGQPDASQPPSKARKAVHRKRPQP